MKSYDIIVEISIKVPSIEAECAQDAHKIAEQTWTDYLDESQIIDMILHDSRDIP